jgi:transcriptional regulator with PAS, ATPase and Fis domain
MHSRMLRFAWTRISGLPLIRPRSRKLPQSLGIAQADYDQAMTSTGHGFEQARQVQDVRLVIDAIPTLAWSSGTFRADLFYRLNVFPIDVPPLRNRKEDIPMLVEYFVQRYAEKARKQITKIDKNTLKLCQSYSWPGNIRELQNIIERSVILCTGDIFWIDEAWLSSPEKPRLNSSGPLTQNVQNYEKELIEVALAESKGKVAGPNGAAAKLGIPRSTLDLKIRQLKIKKHTLR